MVTERPRDSEFKRRYRTRNDPHRTIQEKTLFLMRIAKNHIARKSILRPMICKVFGVEPHSVDREWRKLRNAGKVDYDDTHIYLPVKMVQEPAF